MRRFLTTILLLFLLPFSGGARGATSPERLSELPRPVMLGQNLLQTTNQLWFLLSAVRNREDADRACDEFVRLTTKADELDALFSREEVDVSDEALMEMLVLVRTRIVESYETLNEEVESLCRVRCYGSKRLLQAFHDVVDRGLFEVASLPDCTDEAKPLNESEEKTELARLKRLIEPDKEVLDVLAQVKDSASARKASRDLSALVERLKMMQPARAVLNRESLPSGDRIQKAGIPLQKILWKIRNEIVRIASLPGCEDERYDTFFETLNDVYECLGETHSEWFDDVFDHSFQSDLDEAMHENISANTSTAE